MKKSVFDMDVPEQMKIALPMATDAINYLSNKILEGGYRRSVDFHIILMNCMEIMALTAIDVTSKDANVPLQKMLYHFTNNITNLANAGAFESHMIKNMEHSH